ncbi:MAG: transcriptional repressor [Bacteroidaceae bacterium]|nr:transcriptional repressor [Bacteroidaceae bacterium]
MHHIETILEQRGIRVTSLRVLLLRTMLQQNCAVSLTDLEGILKTVNKSTIFRTLTLFLQQHLVHQVEDGSGQTKYAVCEEDCHCGEHDTSPIADLHTHFYCECCKRTICMRNLTIPQMDIPMGFQIHSANFVLKGICDQCHKTNKE